MPKCPNNKRPSCPIDKLPPELAISVFSYLHRRQLVQCLAVCKTWKDILSSNSLLWPSSVVVEQIYEMFYDVDGISRVNVNDLTSWCQSVSRLPGNIRSFDLKVVHGENAGFSFFFSSFTLLQSLSLMFVEMSVEDLSLVLENCPDLRVLRVESYPRLSFGDQTIVVSRPTVLEELCLEFYDAHLLISSLVSRSPNLVSLKCNRTRATDQLTVHFGDSLQLLDLYVGQQLPRINCSTLRALRLWTTNITAFGQPVDLSSVRCFMIASINALQQDAITLMRFYNIGRNLTCLIIKMVDVPSSIEWDDVFDMIPKLKSLTIVWRRRHVANAVLAEHVISQTQHLRESRGVEVIARGFLSYHRQFAGKTCSICHEIHQDLVEGLDEEPS
jgi:hypothetical protein